MHLLTLIFGFGISFWSHAGTLQECRQFLDDKNTTFETADGLLKKATSVFDENPNDAGPIFAESLKIYTEGRDSLPGPCEGYLDNETEEKFKQIVDKKIVLISCITIASEIRKSQMNLDFLIDNYNKRFKDNTVDKEDLMAVVDSVGKVSSEIENYRSNEQCQSVKSIGAYVDSIETAIRDIKHFIDTKIL